MHRPEECKSPSYGKDWLRWGCLQHTCRSGLVHSDSGAALWLYSGKKSHSRFKMFPKQTVRSSSACMFVWKVLYGTLAHVLTWIKASDVCYINALSSCHTVINSAVFTLPGQVHQQQQGDSASLIPAELMLRDGWKYPLATETDCIIQYINAALRYDKLL